MTRHNVVGALGEAAGPAVDRLSVADDGVMATRLDARMFPHEWLDTAGGWVKTDSADHADDHFYPGPCDIAWDLAATCEEWHLEPAAMRYLLDAYGRASGDRTARARLPFYRVAYLASRAGYAHMAAQQLKHTDEGRRFRAEFLHARARLRELVGSPSPTRGAARPARAHAQGSYSQPAATAGSIGT